jgi:hypothetical protein
MQIVDQFMAKIAGDPWRGECRPWPRPKRGRYPWVRLDWTGHGLWREVTGSRWEEDEDGRKVLVDGISTLGCGDRLPRGAIALVIRDGDGDLHVTACQCPAVGAEGE